MNWYGNLKIRTKLISAFLLITIFMIIVGVVGSVNLKSMNASVDELYSERVIPIMQLSDMKENIMKIRLISVKLLTYQNTLDIDDVTSQIEELRAQNNSLIDQYTSTYMTDEETNFSYRRF